MSVHELLLNVFEDAVYERDYERAREAAEDIRLLPRSAQLDAQVLFTALEVFLGQDVGPFCALLGAVFATASFSSIHEKYAAHMKTGLQSGDREIARLVTEVVSRAEGPPDVRDAVHSGLFAAILDVLEGDDEVAAAAASTSVERLLRLASPDDCALIRNKLSLLSTRGKRRLPFSVLDAATFRQQLEADLSSSDELLRAAAIQTLKETCTSKHAYDALSGIFPLVFSCDNSAFALDALAEIAMVQGVHLDGWQALLCRLQDMQGSDGRLAEAKFFLTGALLSNGSVAVPAALLDELVAAAFERYNPAAVHGVSIAIQHRHVYEAVLEATAGRIFSVLRSRLTNPVPEIKGAWYFMLARMTQQERIARDMVSEGSILPSLLDRRLDASLEGLRWKYGVLETLCRQPWFREVLRPADQQSVIDYLRLGVFFVKAGARVALESAQ